MTFPYYRYIEEAGVEGDRDETSARHQRDLPPPVDEIAVNFRLPPVVPSIENLIENRYLSKYRIKV